MKQTLFALATLSAISCMATVDIPFWGQENPPLKRLATASATWGIPAGFDFRVFSRCFSDVVAFDSGAPGLLLLFR